MRGLERGAMADSVIEGNDDCRKIEGVEEK
jgi:hypothetical protein